MHERVSKTERNDCLYAAVWERLEDLHPSPYVDALRFGSVDPSSLSLVQLLGPIDVVFSALPDDYDDGDADDADNGSRVSPIRKHTHALRAPHVHPHINNVLCSWSNIRTSCRLSRLPVPGPGRACSKQNTPTPTKRTIRADDVT